MTLDIKWSRASLRISSDSLTSQQIATVMQEDPTSSYDIGDPVSKRKPEGPIRKQSLCSYDSDLDSSTSLDLHLAYLINFAENKSEKLTQLLSTCHIDIFCGFSSGNGQGGFNLDNALLTRMARLNIEFLFDLYPPLA